MDAFLPRIRSVFYATFDAREGERHYHRSTERAPLNSFPGPKLVYQVPEGSISTSQPSIHSPMLASASTEHLGNPDIMSLSAISKSPSRPPLTTRPSPSNHKRAPSSPVILDFDSIVEYVIPKNHLCGRLVRCNTPTHRFIGFPVVLTGEKYERNEFRYNLCFVFDRLADLSCYEPIVRKCARVLLSCEVREFGYPLSWNVCQRFWDYSKSQGFSRHPRRRKTCIQFSSNYMKTSTHTLKPPFQSTHSTLSSSKFFRSILTPPGCMNGKFLLPC